MKKKKIIILIILILVTSCAYFIHNQKNIASNSTNLVVYGNVDIRDVSLGFRVSGRIDKLLFEEGDKVKKGDILTALDKKPFEDELALRKAKLSEAQAAYDNAQKIYNRREKLVKTGAVSQTAYDDALAMRDETAARVKTANARVNLAQTQLDDTQILSPNNGTILTRIREEGAIVSAGAPVYSLALSNPVWIRTYVAEPDLGFIFPGQKAIIATDSGDSYQGQIGFISPQAEFTPKNVETTQLRADLVYRLRVIVDNPDNGLRQGMPVTVSIKKRKTGE